MGAVRQRLIACVHFLRIYSLCCHITALQELKADASETEFQSSESIKSFMFIPCIISPAMSLQYQMFCVTCSGKFCLPGC